MEKGEVRGLGHDCGSLGWELIESEFTRSGNYVFSLSTWTALCSPRVTQPQRSSALAPGENDSEFNLLFLS